MGFATVENRLWIPCPTVAELTPDEQVIVCDDCDQYTFWCCQHRDKACHHFRVFYADGACLNNGFTGARAGVGIALGPTSEDDHFSKPFSDLGGEGTARTSQIAELRAAIEALEIIDAFYEANGGEHPKPQPTGTRKRRKLIREDDDDQNIYIIAMDSEYVVNGMTNWIYNWKANGMVTSRGQRPANLDLFLSLDSAITKFEKKTNIMVGFWRIPREYNLVADRLAKAGAQVDTGNQIDNTRRRIQDWTLL